MEATPTVRMNYKMFQFKIKLNVAAFSGLHLALYYINSGCD